MLRTQICGRLCCSTRQAHPDASRRCRCPGSPRKAGWHPRTCSGAWGVRVRFCVRPMVFLTSSLVRVGPIRCVHTRVQAKLTQLWVCAVVTHVPALPAQNTYLDGSPERPWFK